MSDVVIRTATEDDLAAVQTLVNESWRITYGAAIADDRIEPMLRRRHALDLFSEQLVEPGALFLVAVLDDAIVGHAFAQQKPDNLYLDRLHVAPSSKGRGIGKDLMRAVFEHAAPSQPITLELVASNDAARGFYEALGFSVISTTASCGGEMGVAALVMERQPG